MLAYQKTDSIQLAFSLLTGFYFIGDRDFTIVSWTSIVLIIPILPVLSLMATGIVFSKRMNSTTPHQVVLLEKNRRLSCGSCSIFHHPREPSPHRSYCQIRKGQLYQKKCSNIRPGSYIRNKIISS